jgi:hypothetical protein
MFYECVCARQLQSQISGTPRAAGVVNKFMAAQWLEAWKSAPGCRVLKQAAFA